MHTQKREVVTKKKYLQYKNKASLQLLFYNKLFLASVKGVQMIAQIWDAKSRGSARLATAYTYTAKLANRTKLKNIW
jgi:hypothetical protein